MAENRYQTAVGTRYQVIRAGSAPVRHVARANVDPKCEKYRKIFEQKGAVRGPNEWRRVSPEERACRSQLAKERRPGVPNLRRGTKRTGVLGRVVRTVRTATKKAAARQKFEKGYIDYWASGKIDTMPAATIGLCADAVRKRLGPQPIVGNRTSWSMRRYGEMQKCTGIHRRTSSKEVNKLKRKYGERLLVIKDGPNAQAQAIAWRRKHPDNRALIVYKRKGPTPEEAFLGGLALLGAGMAAGAYAGGTAATSGATGAATAGGQAAAPAAAAGTAAKVGSVATTTTAAKVSVGSVTTAAGAVGGAAKLVQPKAKKPYVIKKLEEAAEVVDTVSAIYSGVTAPPGERRPVPPYTGRRQVERGSASNWRTPANGVEADAESRGGLGAIALAAAGALALIFMGGG